MPVIAKTRYEIRHQMMALLGDGALNGIIFTPTSSGAGGGTTTVCTALTGPGNDYYNNYREFIYSGAGSGLEVLITDFVDSTGALTHPNIGAQTLVTSLFEIHRPGWPTVAEYNNAINMAIQKLSRRALNTLEDRSIALEEDRYEYDVPSNFIYINTLSHDDSEIGGDRHPSTHFNQFNNFYNLAANTRLGQGFTLAEAAWIDGVYIFMRSVGSPPAATTVRVALCVDDSSTPGTPDLTTGYLNESPASVSNTVAGNTIQADGHYELFEFPRPFYVPSATLLHIDLHVVDGGSHPSNHFEVGIDTGNNYADGAHSLHGGVSYAAVSGSDMLFRLRQSRVPMYKLPPQDWDIVGASTRQIRLEQNPVDGRVLRIEGQQFAGEPSTDSSNVSVEASALTQVATAILAPRLPLSAANASNIDANYLVQVGIQAEMQYRRVQTIPGSRIVESN